MITAGGSPAELEALKHSFSYLVKSIDTAALLPAALSRNLIMDRNALMRLTQFNSIQFNSIISFTVHRMSKEIKRTGNSEYKIALRARPNSGVAR